jgi:hypothetical protein
MGTITRIDERAGRWEKKIAYGGVSNGKTTPGFVAAGGKNGRR